MMIVGNVLIISDYLEGVFRLIINLLYITM